MKECLHYPIKCQHCGLADLSREKLKQHQDRTSGDCPMKMIPCPFNAIGCKIGMPAKYKNAHLKSEIPEHQDLLLKAYVKENASVVEVKKVVQQLLLMCEAQDRRIQLLEMTSYDGVLVWKISDFNRKRNAAISGRTTSIYSPCFFTSRQGYKMCARIYLNGDGMGKGNHVSLSFVIMRGEYDQLLRWPFRQKVTLMLLDQNHREHVIDAFRPDPTSNSFKKPTGDMNIASGCPLFMPLSQLNSSRHSYVKDDCMFIKIIVDTVDIN
uniref:TNF receptor-associated factor 2-like n=1 Tax=Saccoglossus kowalevskii TaxID=10224 RepID=A0ABM0M679_SACKO|nr:PREDICTED: TNF receptor-associated factor 2-like [Saccoglossus kowalevskii]